MEMNLSLGRIAGIRVGIHWSVLVIWWLLTWSLATTLLPDTVEAESTGAYWVAAGLTAIGLLGCLLAHELSHAVMARRHGVSTESITLWALGGVAQLKEDSPSPRSELLIAGAGPAMSFALAAGAFAISLGLGLVGAPDLVLAGISWLALVNVVLAVFNLLPGIPLDGGRILHALLWWRSKDRVAATRSAAQAGRIFGYVLIGLGVIEITSGYWTGLWLVLIGWFLLSAATAERQFGTLRHTLGEATVADVMSPHPATAPDWVSTADLLDDYVLRFRHSSFPLRDREGRVTGLVTLDDVRRVEPAERATTAVSDIATPLDQVTTVEASLPIVELMTRLTTSGRGQQRRALVVDHDTVHGERIVGIVTPTDIARAVEIGSLTHA
ncbi:MAG: site-2 protease family protein [Acidimicrobiales bacterium]|nr:site-2 protease family protein [Acidimicrobiales bacterium]